MVDHPKRRWLRFSLRTLLLAFTVVAVWFAWNGIIVRQRRNALTELRGQRGEMMVGDSYFEFDGKISRSHLALNPDERAIFDEFLPTATGDLTATRRLLGDQPIWIIFYQPGMNPERVRKLFPEATIVVPKPGANERR